MAITPIPDEDHLLRWVRNRSLIRDPETGQVNGVLADAFRLREGEDYLSALWCEYYAGGASEQSCSAVADFSNQISVKPKDRFVRGRVAEIKAVCALHGHAVRIVHEPVEGVPAHAAVRRYRDDNLEMLEALATEAWASLI